MTLFTGSSRVAEKQAIDLKGHIVTIVVSWALKVLASNVRRVLGNVLHLNYGFLTFLVLDAVCGVPYVRRRKACI